MVDSTNKSLAWAPLALLVLLIGLGSWYAIRRPTRVPVSNQNIAVPTEHLTDLTFSDLALKYPSTWAAKPISGASDCRGFISPELSAYNKAWASTHANVDATDAVVFYDVTVCDQGALTEPLQASAAHWIAQRGADNVSPPDKNVPFEGALRYHLSLLRTWDAVFFENGGHFIVASLDKLPYEHPEANRRAITTLLQSVVGISDYDRCLSSGRGTTASFSCTIDNTTYVEVTNKVYGYTTRYQVATVNGRQVIRNEQDHFSATVPLGYSQQPDPAVYDRIILKQGENAPIIVGTSTTTEKIPTLADYSPVGDIVLGGTAGKKFVWSYCDGPGCTSPIVTYAVIHNGVEYTVDMYGDKTINATEQAFLNSFTFI